MVSVVIERQPPIITVFSPFLAFPFLSLLNRVIHVLRELSRENCRARCYRDYYSIDRFVGESRSEDLEQEREREGEGDVSLRRLTTRITVLIGYAKRNPMADNATKSFMPSFNFDRSLLSPFLRFVLLFRLRCPPPRALVIPLRDRPRAPHHEEGTDSN